MELLENVSHEILKLLEELEVILRNVDIVKVAIKNIGVSG